MPAGRTRDKSGFARRARDLALFLLDVDGVLTDGGIFYDEAGREVKRFHVHDGLGIRWLLQAGLEVGLLSGRTSRAVSLRARELGLSLVYQGVQDKWGVVQDLLDQRGWHPGQVAFMGDDLVDLPVLQRVGLSVGVPNGHPLVRRRVDYVTRLDGGAGAVREAAERILRARGQWKKIFDVYSAV